MHQCSADKDRNRLCVTLKGHITAEESKQVADQVIAELKKLKPGFDVITNIAEFEPAARNEVDMLVKIHGALLAQGVNRIVRVVGYALKATERGIQFERVSRETGLVAEKFNSMEEAERFLDG